MRSRDPIEFIIYGVVKTPSFFLRFSMFSGEVEDVMKNFLAENHENGLLQVKCTSESILNNDNVDFY